LAYGYAHDSSPLIYDGSARSDSAKVVAFKDASRAGTLSYWTVAHEVVPVWFLELLFLFHFDWELNDQHSSTG
jgi:hypothetical protein